MAPHGEHHSQRQTTDTEIPKRAAQAPANSRLDDSKRQTYDEQESGSAHAATLPIEISSGTPVRPGTPNDDRDDGRVTDGLLSVGRGDEDALSVCSGGGEVQPLRARGSSISFHPRVTDDSGEQHSLQGADSAEATPPAGERSASPSNEDDGLQIRASARRRGLRSLDTSGVGSHTLRTDLTRKIIMGSDTGLSEDSEYLDPIKMASLTSATTSQSLNEARTPLGPVKEYFVASPTSTLPPHSFSSLDGSKDGLGRRESRRRERQEMGSRRASRRSSARSNGMSASSSWLAGFGRSGTLDDAINSLQEPDAEGKIFGDDIEYVIGEEIGRGGFSVIKEAKTHEGGKLITRAVKIVRRKRDGQSEIENDKVNSDFDREVAIWRYLHHPNILRMIAVYETDFASFCVMDYIKGGTLLDMMRAQRQRERKVSRTATASRLSSDRIDTNDEPAETPPNGLSPSIAKRYIYQIASALRYLHEDMHIIHRDVKLENCLLDMSDPNAAEQGGNVLLCDFGLADYIHNEGPAVSSPYDSSTPRDALAAASDANDKHDGLSITLLGGSLEYAAPELIGAERQFYSPSVDVWAFGVCAYALIAGALPFSHSLPAKIVQAIQDNDLDIGRISGAYAASEGPDDAVELVRGCLEPDASLRWLVGDVLNCEYLRGCSQLYEEDPALRSAWS